VVLLKLGSKGITEAEAIIFVQALEPSSTKTSMLHRPLLDDPCNFNKQPIMTLFHRKEDLDSSCFISLVVLSFSDYSTGKPGRETFDV
jgi:hypothetical protein